MAKVYSNVDYIDSLLSSSGQATTPVNSWSRATTVGQGVDLTFDWMTGAPARAPAGGFEAFSGAQQAGAEAAMALFAEVADITFTRSSAGSADIEFGTLDFGGTSRGYTAGLASTGWTIIGRPATNTYYTHSDVYLTNAFSSTSNQTPGSSGFATMLHEIGHALGLEHTFENRTPPPGTDSTQYSVLSYTDHPDMWIEPSTPMLYDIAALQYLYGANTTTRTGNDTYQWSVDEAVVMAIWDAGGTDTIDTTNQTRGSTISLAAGTYSSIGTNGVGGNAVNNIAIAYGATIENARGGAGNDEIFGNEIANQLHGNNGDDTLAGFGGADFLNGGLGNDTLNGGDGNDLLWGGIGADAMAGGAGGDVYYVDNAADTIAESAGEGIDWVFSTIGYSLGENVEYLILYGPGTLSANGNDLSNSIVGNVENNSLQGHGGADILNGHLGHDVLNGGAGDDLLWGGVGADTLIGGEGADRYYVDRIGDQLIEQAGGGIDTVYANISYELTDNFEVLNLYGSDNIDATGNSADNTLRGNTANNIIDGGDGDDFISGDAGDDMIFGSLGNDKLYGSSGMDTFVFNTALGANNVDTIIDFSTEDDTIQFDDAVFLALGGPGNLGSTEFHRGTSADDANDRILYDQNTGALFYDADGSGAAAAVQFATLTGTPAISEDDFTIV